MLINEPTPAEAMNWLRENVWPFIRQILAYYISSRIFGQQKISSKKYNKTRNHRAALTHHTFSKRR